jgi:hypothetical protein
MTGHPLKEDVLEELGDDRVQQIAGLLGTDADAARRVVGSSVTALTGALTDDTVTPGGTAELCQAMAQAAMEPEPGPGTTTTVGSGMVAAVLRRVAGPAAKAVAERTGCPEAAVGSALEIIVPVAAAVLARRARS